VSAVNVLIVYAHHERKSFNAAMKDLAISVLTERQHLVMVSDLYGMKFNPVASRDDFAKLLNTRETNYMVLQKSVSDNGKFAKDIADEQEKVKWADFIIFQFPVWWFGPPAILKGWFDRVLACGFAWDFGRIYSSALLRGKKAMLSVTTGGDPVAYTRDGSHQADINGILHPVQHGVLYFCGMEVLPPFVAYNVFGVGVKGRQKYFEDYKQRLMTLEKTQSFKSYPPPK
jgi:NAD(P)H dehydrogenase (quinone)